MFTRLDYNWLEKNVRHNGADQPAHPRSLFCAFVFRFAESTKKSNLLHAKFQIITLYSIITPFEALKIQVFLKILWKMEHLLLEANASFSIIFSERSKCSIFHNIFRTVLILNFTYFLCESFQCCPKIEKDVMI